MAEGTIDRLPVAKLPERYGISRTVLYDRINALKVTPEKQSFRFLEEAYQNEWLLSTSHLADLLELSPARINKKPSFERYGFIFTKAGKNGIETAWKVDKASPGKGYSYAHLPDEL